MKKKIEYSFDDEYVTKFCYDIDNKKIEIHLTGYSDLLKNEKVDKPCVWIIENWTDAKSKLSSESSYNDLEQHLGIVSMVLSAEINKTTLELTVNTIDNRYIDLLFDNPQLKLHP
jgi:hypothetical protein